MISNSSSDGASHVYRYSSRWLEQPREVRIIVVGAGISGIAAVKLFREKFKNEPTTLTIYEKNDEVGGTWLENRYPGCSCDIPAHGYTYSWEGNPDWSGVYVGSKEIFDYYKSRAQAYGVSDYLHLQHRVISATWSKTRGKWKVVVEDTENQRTFNDEAEVLINAGGFLNWKWPDIPGMASYKGIMIHSAKWDSSVSFEGKSIAVIGSGSSAIQIVPELQREAKRLVSFNRSPTWITPEFAAELAPQGRKTMYSKDQKAEWKKNPDKFLEFRKLVESGANRFFDLQVKDSQIQRELFEKFSKNMSSVLAKKEGLSSIIIPDFAVGCRRMTPGHGYLEALVADNVTVTGDPICSFTPTGIETTTGEKFAFDIIVCATGFDTSYRPSFPVIGEKGIDLRDEWLDEPHSYLSVAVAEFPNYFMATGPNFPLANGSLIPCLETTLLYAFESVRKIQRHGIKSLSPKKEVVDDFQAHKDSIMKDMVWTSSCSSWYKNGKVDGKVWGPWPGSALHFIQLLRQPRWEDYDIEYLTPNRFAYLGNGKSEVESTGDDLAWYVNEPGISNSNTVPQ